MAKLTKEMKRKLYTNMVRSRKFDELNVRLASEGKLLTFFHSGQGHEAIGIGACTVLNKDDYLYPGHRGHALPHAIGKGVDPAGSIAEHMGRATGWGRGVTGSHLCIPEFGIPSVAGTIGSNYPIGLGYAISAKKRGKGQVALSFSGDGGVQRGQAHESMNMASVWKLPVVWIVENNQYAMFTPFTSTSAIENIADMASAYNMPGEVVDGMDVEAVYYAVGTAVERARKGEGPSLIECKAYRFRAHSEGRNDVSHYLPRSQEEIEEWKQRDPVFT